MKISFASKLLLGFTVLITLFFLAINSLAATKYSSDSLPSKSYAVIDEHNIDIFNFSNSIKSKESPDLFRNVKHLEDNRENKLLETNLTDSLNSTFKNKNIKKEQPAPMYQREIRYEPIHSFDVSKAVYAGVGEAFDITNQETQPKKTCFNPDGTKMFIVGSADDAVIEYNLGTAFDVSSAVYAGANKEFSIANEEIYSSGLAFNTNGTKMFVIGYNDDAVVEYNLSVAFDVSSAVYAGINEEFSVAGQCLIPTDLVFNTDGTKMFVVGYTNSAIFEYHLGTAFDVSTAIYAGIGGEFSVALQETQPNDLAFNPDGTKMFIIGSNQDTVFEYSLTIGFDISTAIYSGANESLNAAAEGSLFSGIIFNKDGSKLFLIEQNTNVLFEYNIGSISNGFSELLTTNDGTVTGQITFKLSDDTFNDPNNDGILEASVFTINNLPSGFTPTITLYNTDGTTIITNDNAKVGILTLTGKATSHQSTDDIEDLTFTFTDAAFNSATAASILNATGPASSDAGIDFKQNNDTDGDGIFDVDDLDDDNDGILDENEQNVCTVATLNSFVDTVIYYSDPPEVVARADDPTRALGVPDFSNSYIRDPEEYVSLGRAGSYAIFGFSQIYLTNSGDSASDLKVIELGIQEPSIASVKPTPETKILLDEIGIISPDTDGFYELGLFNTADVIDLDVKFGNTFPKNTLKFTQVRVESVSTEQNVETPGPDIDAIQALSAISINCGSFPDTDKDGTPNNLDTDSDNDGCNDVIEAGHLDANNDGKVDGTGVDSDGKVTGASTAYTGNSALVTDSICVDSDGDSIVDFYDLDDDNDGILDSNESICDSGGFNLQHGDNNTTASFEFVNGLKGNANITPKAPGAFISGFPNWSQSEFWGGGDNGSVKTIAIKQLPPAYDKYILELHNVSNTEDQKIQFYKNGIQLKYPPFTTTSGNGTETFNTSTGIFKMESWHTGIDQGTIHFQLQAYDYDKIVITSTDISDYVATAFLVPCEYIEDTDKDGILNHLDSDSDDDFCFDTAEAGHTDADNDGFIDGTGVDANGKVTGATTAYFGTKAAVTNITINSGCVDSDGDTIPDDLDLDADNDGILNTDECPNKRYLSINQDGSWSGISVTNVSFTLSSEIITQTSSLTSHNIGGTDLMTDNSGGRFRVLGSANATDYKLTIDFDNPIKASEIALAIVEVEYDDFIQTVSVSGGTATMNDFSNRTYHAETLLNYNRHTGVISYDSSNSDEQFNFLVGEGDNTLTQLVINCTNKTQTEDIILRVYALLECDTDNDRIPNFLDKDSDNDGCLDALESTGNSYIYTDLDDGKIIAAVDSDNSSLTYGVPAGQNYGIGSSQDFSTLSNQCDPCNGTSSFFSDSDLDGIGDYCDLDDDNDGILDEDEQQSCPVGMLESYVDTVIYYSDPPEVVGRAADPTRALGVSDFSNSFIRDPEEYVSLGRAGSYAIFGFSQIYLTNSGDSASDLKVIEVKFQEASIVSVKPTPETKILIDEIGNISPDTDGFYELGLFYTVDVIDLDVKFGNSFQKNVLKFTQVRVKSISNVENAETPGPDIDAIQALSAIYLHCNLFQDTDKDGTPDYLDTDSDNDGCTDAIEAGHIDANNDGIVDGLGVDSNGKISGASSAYTGTSVNVTDLICIDTDSDFIIDFYDLDDDNDGILDSDESICESGSFDPIAPFRSMTGSFSFVNGLKATVEITPPVTSSFGFNYPRWSKDKFWSGGGSGSVKRILINQLPPDHKEYEFHVADIASHQTQKILFFKNGVQLSTYPAYTTTSGNNSESFNALSGIFKMGDSSTGATQAEIKFDLQGYEFDMIEVTSIGTSDYVQYEFIIPCEYTEDTDSDGTPNNIDTDSDNDGCPDALESEGNSYTFTDLDGGKIIAAVDSDNSKITYGVPAGQNYDIGTSQDFSTQSDHCYSCNSTSSLFTDTDQDGLGDACDLDDDNDGILDADECPQPTDLANYIRTKPTDFGISGPYPSAKMDIAATDISTLFNLPTGSVIIEIKDAIALDENHFVVRSDISTKFIFGGSYPYFKGLKHDPFIPTGGHDGILTNKPSDFAFNTSTVTSGLVFSQNGNTQILENSTPNNINGTTNEIAWISNRFEVESVTGITTEITAGSTFILYISPACDSDTDGTPDHLDTDSDNDGCPDALESEGNSYTYTDLDGGRLTAIIDSDNSSITFGVPASQNYAIGSSQDTTIKSIECNSCNANSSLFNDFDLDGVGDQCDLDDDNDGILDVNEQQNCTVKIADTYVDEVLFYTYPPEVTESINNPASALGPPDNPTNSNPLPKHYVSLGKTGNYATFGFSQVYLSNSGNASSDIKVFEIGTIEAFKIGLKPTPETKILIDKLGIISIDSEGFYDLGSYVTTDTIDIDVKFGNVYQKNVLTFTEIKILSDSSVGSTPGPEIDAVQALFAISSNCNPFPDTDSDTKPNHQDTDSDNDSCTDASEAGHTDADNDGEIDGTGIDSEGKITGEATAYSGKTASVTTNDKITNVTFSNTNYEVCLNTEITITATVTGTRVIDYGSMGSDSDDTKVPISIDDYVYKWYLDSSTTPLIDDAVYSNTDSASLTITDVPETFEQVTYRLEVITINNSCPYVEEVYLNVSTTDIDGDGVLDCQEILDQTDPNDSCSFLLENQTTTPNTSWQVADCDNDGFDNQTEVNNSTDPLSATDSDGDGVSDEKEDVDGTNANDSCSFLLENQTTTPNTSWQVADCDNDGIDNQTEVNNSTDPLSATDSDGDGVSDEKEGIDNTDIFDDCSFILASQTMSPNLAWAIKDCDGDGVDNQKEVDNGTDPLNFQDSDGDGISDDQERDKGTDPNNPCDQVELSLNVDLSNFSWVVGDCDGDGVPNGTEADPDGNGSIDGNYTDPYDSCDFIPADITYSVTYTGNCGQSDTGVTCGFDLSESETCQEVENNPTGDFATSDCDGDGQTNKEECDNDTDPTNPCDGGHLSNVDLSDTSSTWHTADCDGDGITNGKEVDPDGDGIAGSNGTDPYNPCDQVELNLNVDLSNFSWVVGDCDGDGVPNGREVNSDGDATIDTNYTNPYDPCDFNAVDIIYAVTAFADCDGDGVTTNPIDPNGPDADDNDPCNLTDAPGDLSDTSSTWHTADCDGDGITNGKEVDPDGDGIAGPNGTDPYNPCNQVELNLNVDLSNFSWVGGDCDGDGVPNGREVNSDGDATIDTNYTNPYDPCDFIIADIIYPIKAIIDCDGDGVDNQTEINNGTNPFTTSDSDGDGVSNEKEGIDGTDANDNCSFVLVSQTTSSNTIWENADCDGDGVDNQKEVDNGTDPLNFQDSDGDGISDDQERDKGTDPNNPCDQVELSLNVDLSNFSWVVGDCDGDGVPNGTEADPDGNGSIDGNYTDPYDSCDFIPADITYSVTYTGNCGQNDSGITCGTSLTENEMCREVEKNPTGDFATSDCDGDGQTNKEECDNGTDPTNPCDGGDLSYIDLNNTSSDWYTADCDGDGVQNGREVNRDGNGGFDTNHTNPFDPCDFIVADITDTVTAIIDCDGDGSDNQTEVKNGTDPLTNSDLSDNDDGNDHGNDDDDGNSDGDGDDDRDGDSDGLTNEEESQLGTNPTNPDSDDDGIFDGQEVLDNTNPLDNCDHIGGSSLADNDCDEDGLTTAEENELGTDEKKFDTDGDSISDGQEKIDETDPLNPCNHNGGVAPAESSCGIKVMNDLISPSNNASFLLENIERFPENQVEIFNRWGIKVFQTEGYDNISNLFKGYSGGRITVQKNENLPVGVYFYVVKFIDINSNLQTENGYIYITE